MIKASAINPWGLSSVTLNDATLLPDAPGIYFALKGRQVLYIGISSVSLRRRWYRHHRSGDLLEAGNVSLAYLPVNAADDHLKALECDLIDIFNPVLNRGPVYSRTLKTLKRKPPAPCFVANINRDDEIDFDDDVFLTEWIEQTQESEYFELGIYD